MRTRFAKIVLACAGIHDIILWVALGYATAIASQEGMITFSLGLKTILINLGFIGGILLTAHFLFNRFTFFKNNFFFQASHLGYFLFTMFMLAALAGYLHVETIFGALLAGIMIKLSIPTDEVDKVEYIVSKVGFAWFIPLYFAIVGLQLDLIKHFNPFYFLGFLLFACFVQTLSVYLTSRMIKQDHLTSLNLAIAINDRGGPGIDLASIAYSTGIVNQEFFAVLVMLALMTSFLPGVWFRIVLKKKWRLMPGDENLVPDRSKDN